MLPSDCADQKELLRALFSEFLAMLLFVFLGTGSVASSGEFLTQDGISRENTVGRLMPIAMAFGMSIMVLVYSVGHLSGGHINPAVTFMLWWIKKISTIRATLYVLMQLCGAVCGSFTLWAAVSSASNDGVGYPPYALGANSLNGDLSQGNGFVLEMMGTFILCLVVLLTAVNGGGASDGQPNLAPLCIGFTVFLVHLVLIPFTGCGINPARTFGPAVVNIIANGSHKNSGTYPWGQWSWIYYVGPLVGALLAVGCQHILFDPMPDVLESNIDVHKYHMAENEHTTGFNSIPTELSPSNHADGVAHRRPSKGSGASEQSSVRRGSEHSNDGQPLVNRSRQNTLEGVPPLPSIIEGNGMFAESNEDDLV